MGAVFTVDEWLTQRWFFRASQWGGVLRSDDPKRDRTVGSSSGDSNRSAHRVGTFSQ